MKILSVGALLKLVEQHGLENFILDLIQSLKSDLIRWDEFVKVPRQSMETKDGFLELMPIHDHAYHMFKYVNCFPNNPFQGKQTVISTGQLNEIKTGYPVIVSEMTILTALRTAATTALATDLMSRKDSSVLAIIGTGAQSEFQAKAIMLVRNIKEIKYFDIDEEAMDKFEKNIKNDSIKLTRCKNAEEAVRDSDIVTTCTACKGHVDVIKNSWIQPGMHLNGIGGDCPGKTELELEILQHSRIVTDYFDQAIEEGELQLLQNKAKDLLYAELYELANGSKIGRESDEEVTLFDSVGMALEDYSALRFTYELSKKYDIGDHTLLVPSLDDPKDLISVFNF